MIDYIKTQPELRQRFIDHAFKNDPDIQDLNDFKNALFRAFDTQRGINANRWFNDDEVIELFDSSECREEIRLNISDEEFKKIYGEVSKGELEVQRVLPKGQSIVSRQVRVVSIQKKISVNPYTRLGKNIKTYNRGFQRWKPAEVKFIQVRKMQKISPKKIIYEYNQHFKTTPRSSSSVRTKLYRI